MERNYSHHGGKGAKSGRFSWNTEPLFVQRGQRGGCSKILPANVPKQYSFIQFILMLLYKVIGLRRGLQAKNGQDDSDPPSSRRLRFL